jgi:Uma2 family endonuclease
MSTVTKHPGLTPPPIPPEPDPFRYGWRYVRNTQPDGTEVFDQIPLTLEDVLHPEEGDFIVQTDAHDSERAYLKAVFKTRLIADPTAVVLSDCRVDWNIPGVRPLGPDVAVFFGARRHILWSTFNVAEEGVRPALVIEVTSPETRVNDVGPKVGFYHRAKVPWYVIADVDEDEQERQIQFIAYRRRPARYQRIKLKDPHRVWLEPVRLWLGLTRARLGGYIRLACFDPDTGQEIGDYTAISEELAEAQALVSAEAQARAEAEKRIRELEAELKRSRRRKP